MVASKVPINVDAWKALWDINKSTSYENKQDTTHELRLRLRTPAIFSLYKADVPVAGLPTLDGFLKFLAFRQALAEVMRTHPRLGNDLLWQWNAALRDQQRWIEFSIPICDEKLNDGVVIYDCSVGLPVTKDGYVLYPAGAFFACEGNLVSYPSEKHGPADQIALRRRSVEPIHRPFDLTVKEFNTQAGATKALDNRIYYALTSEYAFYFRGDKDGVKKLLNFAIQHDIGIGKKTTLGYGRIADFEIRPSSLTATLGRELSIPGMPQVALLKNIPYQEIQRRCVREQGDYVPIKKRESGKWVDILEPNEWDQNERLFGAREFSLASPIETFDRYWPPYWRREDRTQVLRYGTLLLPR
jgi:hypothetical protein